MIPGRRPGGQLGLPVGGVAGLRVRRAAAAMTLAVLAGVPAPVDGQEDREALVERAAVSSLPAALELLFGAARPPADRPDGLSLRAAEAMARLLETSGEVRLARAWRAWSARHGPSAPAPGGREGYVGTSWRWPDAHDPGATGVLEVRSVDPALDLVVALPGRREGGTNVRLEAPPGTVDLVITAPGHDTVRVARELLPGVTTHLDVDLPPRLAGRVEAAVERGLVRIHAPGDPTMCHNGVRTTRGLILAPASALGVGAELSATTGSGAALGEIRVLASDSVVAILGPRDEPDGLGPDEVLEARLGSRPADGAHAWAVYQAGCARAASQAGRLTGWAAGGVGVLRPAMAPDALGAALVDGEGRLLGLLTDPGAGERSGRAVPLEAAEPLLQEALLAWDRGPPWRYILPAAAVTLSAVVWALASSGSDTGRIIVAVPGGGS